MTRQRLRELGIRIGRLPTGPLNAITDVAGVEVGHFTLLADEPTVVRSGVTAMLPAGKSGLWDRAAFAGTDTLNGHGEMTGRAWVDEMGMISAPICLTSTYGVGAVYQGVTAICDDLDAHSSTHFVVAETYDGWLSDPVGFPLQPDHVAEAVGSADGGPVAEGNVGGGTGMICHEFKGGIGTASRRVDEFTVGVLVQANYGRRSHLSVGGIPAGRMIGEEEVPVPKRDRHKGDGSIIVVIATDAPLLPIQCRRLARRGSLGLGRVGGTGANGSGDFFLAFATGNRVPARTCGPIENLTMLPHRALDPLFDAAIEATEEAILNALCAAETMTGRDDRTVHALPLDRLSEICGS